MIIGICGLIGSGKDTAADYLVNLHHFRRESFANTLKDAVAQVFGWDRTMLEGRTKHSREWREQVDPWWAERLNMLTKATTNHFPGSTTWYVTAAQCSVYGQASLFLPQVIMH
jgi:hypothetical protein